MSDPGHAIGVYRDGRLIDVTCTGLADVENGVAITDDTVFNIASVSKQFTAFAVHLLASDGAIDLDDPITTALPELEPSAPKVTIRQLVHHTGGLRDYMELFEQQGITFTDVTTAAQTLAVLAEQTSADAPPGTAFTYSNTGYFLLGQIVQRVSGRTLPAFAQERIFGPLAMARTTIVDAYPLTITGSARGYAPGPDGTFVIEESPWEQTGDGQVHTTLRDIAMWENNFRTSALGGAELRALTVPGRLNSGEEIPYGGGLNFGTHRGLPFHGHAGGWAGYVSYLLRFPDHGLSVAVLCNHNDAEPEVMAYEAAGAHLPA